MSLLDWSGNDRSPYTASKANFNHMINLTQAILYLLNSHREALEAQAAQFEAQGQQIRWGTDQLPRGVNRQATADQLAEAAAKIRSETERIEVMEESISSCAHYQTEDVLAALSDFRAPGDEVSDD
jgi:hypothetical protein